MAAQLEAKRSVGTLVQALTKGQLSMPRLLLVVLALVLVAYAGLGVSFMRHREDRARLTAEVLDGETALAAAEAGAPLEDMQQRLAELTDLQAILENSFPNELKTANVIDTILRRAQEHRVTLVRIDISAAEVVQPAAGAEARATPPAPPADAAAAPAEEASPTGSYQRAVVTAQFQGSLPDLIAFMSTLEARVGSASTVEAFSLKGAPQGFTLDLQVQTFARQPAESPPTSGGSPAAEGEALP